VGRTIVFDGSAGEIRAADVPISTEGRLRGRTMTGNRIQHLEEKGVAQGSPGIITVGRGMRNTMHSRVTAARRSHSPDRREFGQLKENNGPLSVD